MSIFLLILSAFFGLHVGASGAASLAIPHGAGILDRRWALVAAASGLFLGATLAGEEVVRTLGAGLLGPGSLPPGAVAVVLGAASASLVLATRQGVPVSTSEVTVGALAGVGLASGRLQLGVLGPVVAGWVVLPLAALALGYGFARLLPGGRGPAPGQPFLGPLLVAAGFFQAFAAGANNAANTVGPLVAVGLLPADSSWPAGLGGLFMGAGALLLGAPILHTAGRQMARFSPSEGALAAAIAGALVLVASLLGLPVPLTQALTLALVGVSRARRAPAAQERATVRRVARLWMATPVMAFSLALVAVRLLAR